MGKRFLILITLLNMAMLCTISYHSKYSSHRMYGDNVFEQSYMANMADNTLCDTTNATWHRIRACIADTASYTLVLRFTDKCCSSCISSAARLLNRHAEAIGCSNICIMGYRRNLQLFQKEMEDLKLSHFKCVNIRQLNMPYEELKYPYFFVMDSALNVSQLFIPDKQYTTCTQKSLTGIGQYFEDK